MKTDLMASIHLGKKSLCSDKYDKSLLVRVPREENRNFYGIYSDDLPFIGFDVWHAYEFSVLQENGVPLSQIVKLKYSCKSLYIIESKSLKLYLNSFNMTRIGKDYRDCLKKCRDMIANDLSEILESEVEVDFFDGDTAVSAILNNYADIMKLDNYDDITIVDFKENPNLLCIEDTSTIREYRLRFNSLRSNCRVTHQPDFGDIFIYYTSKRHIKENSLIKYLTSFRSEYHFHEECCEMIYKRLSDILDTEDKLAVCALYTRRGGIDINPVRMSLTCSISDFDDLLNVGTFTRGSIKQ